MRCPPHPREVPKNSTWSANAVPRNSIYDLGGRLVKVLDRGERSAGEHRVD